MGSGASAGEGGGSVAAAGAAKVAISAGVATFGLGKLAVGAIGSAVTLGENEFSKKLLFEGIEEAAAGTKEIIRDTTMVLTTTGATVAAAAASGVHRALEDGTKEGALAALGGVFLDAPRAAAASLAEGRGAGGAVVGALVAGHGKEGSLQDKVERQLTRGLSCRGGALAEIRKMDIAKCLEPELPLWQLSELAAAVYHDPLPENPVFKPDLENIRDPDEEVEAKMTVFVRRGKNVGGRGLAVLVFRGTKDKFDAARDLESIIGNGYPAPIILVAAEIVKMYQGQGCDVMVAGHSLGGYLAEVLATTLGLNGAGFCAPGPGIHNGEMAGSLPGFHAIQHDADNIGNYNHEFHQAPPVYISDGGVVMLPSTAHSIKKMAEFVYKREDWTNLNVLDKCKDEKHLIPYHVFKGSYSYRP